MAFNFIINKKNYFTTIKFAGFDNNSTKQAVILFVNNITRDVYDSQIQRQNIITAYHPNATFSISIPINYKFGTISSEYIQLNRNHLEILKVNIKVLKVVITVNLMLTSFQINLMHHLYKKNH